MAITFKDFIVECELYPYSKEHFELMKECSELELSEKYINNQIFLSEYMDLSDSSIQLENNFFQESVEDSNLLFLTEKYADKFKSLLGKIVVKLSKIFKVFSVFFGKIGNKFDVITSKGQQVLKQLNSTELTNEQLDDLKKIIDTIRNEDKYKFPIKKNQPYAKKIKFTYEGKNDAYAQLKDELAVALSDNTVVAETLFDSTNDHYDEERMSIMDPDDLYEIGIKLKSGTESDIINLVPNMLTSWSRLRKSGLIIHVNTNNINKTAEKLTYISKELSNALDEIKFKIGFGFDTGLKAGNNAINNKFAANSEQKKDDSISHMKDAGLFAYVAANYGKLLNANGVQLSESDSAKFMNYINDLTTKLTGVIGITTKVYTQLNAYRQAVIYKIDEYLNPKSGSKKDNTNNQ